MFQNIGTLVSSLYLSICPFVCLTHNKMHLGVKKKQLQTIVCIPTQSVHSKNHVYGVLSQNPLKSNVEL